jgi:hypothetical protein
MFLKLVHYRYVSPLRPDERGSDRWCPQQTLSDALDCLGLDRATAAHFGFRELATMRHDDGQKGMLILNTNSSL